MVLSFLKTMIANHQVLSEQAQLLWRFLG
jgi:hypothetical protein